MSGASVDVDDNEREKVACRSACLMPFLIMYVFSILVFWSIAACNAYERRNEGPWELLTDCLQAGYGLCVMLLLGVPLYFLVASLLSLFALLSLLLCPTIMIWAVVWRVLACYLVVEEEDTMESQQQKDVLVVV